MYPRLVGLLAAVPLLAMAQANPIVERYTYSYVDPGASGTFAGAAVGYNNSLRMADGFTGDALYSLSALPLATNISFYAVNGATVTPTSSPDGTPVTPVQVTGNGGNGQGWGFDYHIVASPVAGQSFLQQDVVDGHQVLRFTGGGTGLIPTGARFYSSVVIQGDWSSPVSHSPVLYGAGYSLIQDFEYDGFFTRFTIDTSSYNGTNPSIAFYLIGAPVPEPASGALLLSGLGLVVLLSRRRQAAGATVQR